MTGRYARGYLALGLVREAAAELRRTRRSDHRDPDHLEAWIEVHLEARRWEALERASGRLVEADPKREKGWVFRAYAARERGRVAEAARIAAEGLHLHPGSALLRFNLGCYLSLLGRLEESEAHLRAAVRSAPGFAQDALTDPDYEALRAALGAGFEARIRGGGPADDPV